MAEPTVTRHALLNIQVCVPKEWSNKQAIEFAEREYPAGTELGWCAGRLARVNCDNGDNMIHVVLDA